MIETAGLHFDLGEFDGLFHFFQRLLRLLTVLDQRQILLLQLGKDVQQLLRLREVQLRLLKNWLPSARLW